MLRHYLSFQTLTLFSKAVLDTKSLLSSLKCNLLIPRINIMPVKVFNKKYSRLRKKRIGILCLHQSLSHLTPMRLALLLAF